MKWSQILVVVGAVAAVAVIAVVAGGGGKDGGFGYVKAANDKLYALSGS
jgi:hypothetical protein